MPFPSLAIVGMACRFPGADDLGAFWELLRDGRCAISEVPADWLDRDLYYTEQRGVFGRSYCQHAGLVTPRPVDRSRCPLPEGILATRDPFHLALVEVVAEAARHAGFDPFDLPTRRGGVYLGCADTSALAGDFAYHTYADRLAGLLREVPAFRALSREVRRDAVRDLVDGIRRDNPGITSDGIQQLTAGAAAGLVSQVFGLTGPAYAADAACASSFVALRLAASALASGRIDLAIVAGASIRKWYELVMLSQIQSLGTRRSIPFDAAADGFLGADGYAAILLKTLPQALADGDRIRGVIRGLGMSTDGRGKSFWAPRKEGQTLAIRRAYADGLDPSRVSSLEAHATSTQIGDATEIASLVESLGPHLRERIPISSVKASIGHTLEVAGLAGLIKTVLAFEHETVPPAVGCTDPNPSIDWDAIPFQLLRTAQPWPRPTDGRPRRAAIDSFGIGGLNTHLVLDESPEEEERAGGVERGATVTPSSGWPCPPIAEHGHVADDVTVAPDHSRAGGRVSSAADGPAVAGSTSPVSSGLSSSRPGHREDALTRPPGEQTPHPQPLSPEDRGEGGQADAGAIAVIGCGALYPGGFTAEAFHELLDAGRDPIGPCPPERWHERVAGLVDDLDLAPPPHSPPGGFLAGYAFDWKRHKLPPKQVANANPLQFLILDATEQALRDSGYLDREYDRSRVATVVGAIFTGDFAGDSFCGIRLPETRRRLELALRDRGATEAEIEAVSAAYAAHLLDSIRAPLDETASYNCSTHASRITKTFDLMGGAFAIDAGDASALAAVSAAIDLLRTGTCDMVVCAAGQRALDPVQFATLAARSRCRPDDVPRDVLPPEGAGVLILKRLADARRDGDRVRGVVRGVGVATSFDGATAPTNAGLRLPCGRRGGAGGMAALQKSLFDLETRPAVDNAGGGVARMFALAESTDGLGERGHTVWCAVIEAGTVERSAGSPDAVAAPSESSNDSPSPVAAPITEVVMPSETHVARIESLVRETFLEFTGYPPALFDWNEDLVTGLSLDPATRLAMSSALLEACGLPRQSPIEPRAAWDTLRTAGAWRDHLLTASGLEVPTHAPSTNGNGRHAVAESVIAVAPRTPVAPEAPAVTAAPCAPAPDAARFAKRFVLRAVPLALPDDAPTSPTFYGPALIVGNNPTADALREKLTELGVPVHALTATDDPAAAVAEFDRLWSAGPIPHLFLTTPRDAAAAIDPLDPAAWSARRTAGLIGPYLVAQRWFSSISEIKYLEWSTLAATTALGGDFGLAGHVASVESGGLTGLLKGVDVETSGQLRVRVVDAAANEPAKLVAAQTLRELAAATSDVEVGLIRGRRHVLRAQRQDAGALPPRTVTQGGTWIVTGGGRGVTAFVARELGRRFGLRLHLVGSSPRLEIPPEWLALDDAGLKSLKGDILREARDRGESPDAAWSRVEKGIELERALGEFDAAGVATAYHPCDVADRESLAALLAGIRAVDGPIVGVLHGAGYEHAGSFPKKTRDGLERTLAAKVDGALALMELTRDDPLEAFVGFGSTSGRFGGFGQADYSLANDLLCKLLDAYQDRHPTRRAFAIHWGAWGGIGMAVRPQSLSMLKLMKVGFMPPQEGAEFLIEELQAATRDAEILVVDHPGGFFSERALMPTAETLAATESLRPLVADAPLIEDVVPLGPGDGLARIEVDPCADPFLTGHRHEGTPLYPAVMGIEACAQAARLVSGGRTPVGVRDLKLQSGFRLALERPHRAAVRATVTGDVATCQLSGDFYDKQGRFVDPQRLYHACEIELADGPRALIPPDLGPFDGTWEPLAYPQHWTEMREGLGGSVFYGPELRSLREVQHFENGIRGRHVAGALSELGGSRPGTWLTPAALLDSLLYACDVLCLRQFGTKQLPHVLDRIAFGRPPRPGERCLSRCTITGWDGKLPVFDGWLVGEDGTAIVHFAGFHIVGLNVSLQDAVKHPAK